MPKNSTHSNPRYLSIELEAAISPQQRRAKYPRYYAYHRTTYRIIGININGNGYSCCSTYSVAPCPSFIQYWKRQIARPSLDCWMLIFPRARAIRLGFILPLPSPATYILSIFVLTFKALLALLVCIILSEPPYLSQLPCLAYVPYE